MGFECFSSEDGYTSFSLSHMEDDQLLVAKGRTARYELGVQQVQIGLGPLAGEKPSVRSDLCVFAN